MSLWPAVAHIRRPATLLCALLGYHDSRAAPFWGTGAVITTLQGDCRAVLSTLPEKSVQMCVTSPPFYGLRSYLPAGHPDKASEIGQEPIPDCLAWARGEPPCERCYVCALRAVFAGVWRVLRDDGLLFLNLGDSYSSSTKGSGGATTKQSTNAGAFFEPVKFDLDAIGVSEKNLLGVPWRVALALQADRWVLRNDNIWAKNNPMPESVQDRCTRAHEYVFMLAKGPRYFYDATAVAESAAEPERQRSDRFGGANGHAVRHSPGGMSNGHTTRNRRTVWTINTRPYADAHYAVFPEALVEIPIRVGSSAQACEHCGAAWRRVVERETTNNTDWMQGNGDGRKFEGKVKQGFHGGGSALNRKSKTEYYANQPKHVTIGFAPGCNCHESTGSAASVVLDPFAGSGTTLRVAERLGRDAIGIELSESYITDHIEKRTNGVQKEMFV